jgi:hypothetical protein
MSICENNKTHTEYCGHCATCHECLAEHQSLLELKSTAQPKKLAVKVVKASNTRSHQVVIDGVDFGDFDELDVGTYSYFPKKQDRLTGDHYIAIGDALNKLNKLENS